MNKNIDMSSREVEIQQSQLLAEVPEQGVKDRLDSWLASIFSDLSRARIQQLIKEGFVTLNNQRVKANAKPKPGDIYTVLLPPPVSAVPQPQKIDLDILYEDEDCIVINKPAGLVVHPAPGHFDGTLVNALLYHCRDLQGVGGVERPGIVHRLDKDTSGVMVAVKNDRAMAGFVGLFQSGAMRKEYLALVHGAPAQSAGSISSLIGRDPLNRKKMAVVKVNGKHALTHYRIARRMDELSLMDCRIETGRTHQIRVHMKMLGTPVIGDALYGKAALDKKLPVVPQRQMLHAFRLSFRHPITHIDLVLEAPMPQDFKCYL